MTSILYIDGGGPVEVSYVDLFAGSVVAGGGTVASVPLGDAASGRKAIIAVHAFAGGGTNPALSAASIGGVSASIFTGSAFTPDSNDPGLWWIGAEVPTGTTGGVFLNFSTAVGLRLGVFRMLNAVNLAAAGQDVDPFGFTASPQTTNANVLDKGVQFAAATVLHNGGSRGFTAGISSPSYGTAFGGGDGYVMGGFELITADATARAVTIAKTGGGNWRGVLGTASFR